MKQALTDAMIREKIRHFLAENYVFCKLELDRFIGGGIRYVEKNGRGKTSLPDGQTGEQLMEQKFFNYWRSFVKTSPDFLYGEFMIAERFNIPASKKTLIKSSISDLVENSDLTRYIPLNPQITTLAAGGRKLVRGVVPLSRNAGTRVPVELEAGDTCYICTSMSGPFVASPALVLEKKEHRYRVLYFTNVRGDLETTKTEVNAYNFLSPQKDEIGLSPEQAVQQRW